MRIPRPHRIANGLWRARGGGHRCAAGARKHGACGARLIGAVMTCLALCGASCSRQLAPKPGAEGQFYVTRQTLEPDKLASIWLIKRFVHPHAQFRFLANDWPLTNGIPFDTPEAEFRRYATVSCYESILRKHPIQNDAVRHLGNIIHDIEINFWAEKRLAETAPLDRQIRALIQAEGHDPNRCVEKALAFFDRFVASSTNSIGGAAGVNQPDQTPYR